jgi:hypothetical protein
MPWIIPTKNSYHKWRGIPSLIRDVRGPPTSGRVYLSATMMVDLSAMVVIGQEVVVVLHEMAVMDPRKTKIQDHMLQD